MDKVGAPRGSDSKHIVSQAGVDRSKERPLHGLMDEATSYDTSHRRKPVLQVRLALLALDFYKVWLSPLLAGSCRYEPTCSRYAYEAIERFGLARGVWLGTKRLLRCHPFTKRFGYDPVPEKWEEMRRETWEKQVEAGRCLPGQAEEPPVKGGVRS
ncbi:MAG TPA: membrane protein insertion efficiency factor YidD [Verrucomicrobiae bacterium]|nr:membrane protein insertion efficiency factor YidD [Verrucomicrobiae bacterium]